MGFVGFVLCMKYETTRDGVIFIQPSWDLILEMKHREKGKGWEFCEVKILR
jgi:hypothetical protein